MKVFEITKEIEEPVSPLRAIFLLGEGSCVWELATAARSFPSWGDCPKSSKMEVLVNLKTLRKYRGGWAGAQRLFYFSDVLSNNF